MSKKEVAYFLFLVLIGLFYLIRHTDNYSNPKFQDTAMAIEGYEARLKVNLGSTLQDDVVLEREREQLLMAIEERIVAYLYQIPDYSYMGALETYLQVRPQLLEQFPSAVPLEKGDYSLTSRYGIRSHPISGKTKKHFGIDLAASFGTPVHASASGTVLDIIDSKTGYGTLIIIKHRFGFQTLYGHLNKILVRKGQQVKQHEVIGTVGNTGSSTGYHLHYEIMKNKTKIDPRLSLNLKQQIYAHLIELKLDNDGEK